MTLAGTSAAAPLTRGRMTGRAAASPVLNAPGVSVVWAGPLFRQLDSLRSDVTGFVGFAPRGPVNHALRLASASEFDQVYGPPLDGSFLAPAVHGFFANGGVTCWIVRAVDLETAAAAGADVSAAPGIRLEARSPGMWGNGIAVDIEQAGGGRLTVTVTAPDGRREVWRNLDEQGLRDHFSADITSAESVSALVSIELDQDAAIPAAASRNVLSGGRDGLENVTPAHLTGDETISIQAHGAALLADIEEIGLITVPDLVVRDPAPAAAAPARAVTACPGPREPVSPDTGPASPAGLPAFDREQIISAQAQLIGDCQALQRIALLHHPDPGALADDAVQWRSGFNSAYAALYWPWLQIPDPVRPSQVIAVPPSGHVAGVVARSDWSAGPHKPPANELVAGAVGLTRRVEDEDHARVNSAGINVIRSVAGRGIRVLGARTMSDEPQWRYLNVRRLMSQIERSVAAYAAWVVFEPDAEALHADVERVIRQFLDELWRSGALDGSTAEQAYSVTVEDAAGGGEGRLVVEIGVQPPWPAEFVVVRIDVTELGARSVAGGGFRGGVNG